MLRRGWLIGALLALSTTAHAQMIRGPLDPILPWNVQALTTCTYGGVQSVMDMRLLRDREELPGLVAHEAKHQEQMRRDRTVNCAPTWAHLVWMEAEAYCRGTAPEHLADGVPAQEVYADLLGRMLFQFNGHVPPELVRTAWFVECHIYLDQR